MTPRVAHVVPPDAVREDAALPRDQKIGSRSVRDGVEAAQRGLRGSPITYVLWLAADAVPLEPGRSFLASTVGRINHNQETCTRAGTNETHQRRESTEQR